MYSTLANSSALKSADTITLLFSATKQDLVSSLLGNCCILGKVHFLEFNPLYLAISAAG